MATVYVIKHPVTEEVVYVGKTTQELDKRLSAHVSAAKARWSKCRLHRWIRSLGRAPLITPFIVDVPVVELDKFEALAFVSLKKSGVKLLNMQKPDVTEDGRPTYSLAA